MTDRIHSTDLAREIRQIYGLDASRAETFIEEHLEKKLTGLSAEKRLGVLEKIRDEFNPHAKETPTGIDEEDAVLLKVCAFLLGRDICHADLSSADVLERLAESLNTIFDMLNQLIRVINATLFGRSPVNETIRHVIGSQLEYGGGSESLETYLGQIHKAFLITQQAFKNAAYSRVSEILSELDPVGIGEAGGGGFKFGPLRKAECFEIYEKKFHSCKKWFESGRFMEALLREFEKNCQKLSE